MNRFLLLALALASFAVAHAAAEDAAVDEARLESALRMVQDEADPELRLRGVAWLRESPEPRAVQALLTAIDDPVPEVRQAASKALLHLASTDRLPDAARGTLSGALANEDAKVAMDVSLALDDLGTDPSELVATWRRVLNSGEPFDRYRAAMALLGHAPAAELAPTIVDFVVRRGENFDVRSAIGSIDRPADQWMVPAHRALDALRRHGDRDLLPALVDGLGRSWLADQVLIDALATYDPPPEAWPSLLAQALLTSSADYVYDLIDRLEAATGTGPGFREWADELAGLCRRSDRDLWGRILPLIRAAGIHGEEAVECPLWLFGFHDPGLRAAAVDAVGAIADASQARAMPEITDRLQALARELAGLVRLLALDDVEASVRRAAALAYARLALPPRDIADLLLDIALNDPESSNRESVLEAMVALGPAGGDYRDQLAALAAAGASSDVLDRLLVIGQQATDPVSEAPGEVAWRTIRRGGYRGDRSGFRLAIRRFDLTTARAFIDVGQAVTGPLGSPYDAPALNFAVQGAPCDDDADDLAAMLALLIERGASPRETDARGNDALMTAIRHCPTWIIAQLLDAGAALDHENEDEQDAFSLGLNTLGPGLDTLIERGYRASPERVARLRRAYGESPERLAVLDRVPLAPETVEETP